MSNKKSTPKVKEPIKIRFKKLTNGNKSVYLARWNSDSGKWEYEFLKDLYIVPDSNNPIFKAQNLKTLELAKAIQAKRIVELQNNAHGFTNSGTRSKVNLIDYIKNLAEKKKEKAGGDKRGNYQNYLALAYHIQKYSNDRTTFKSIDKRYCEGFLEYLKTATRGNAWGDRFPLNQNTQWGYMKKLETVLNAAVADEVITVNPFRYIKQENKPEKHRSEICFLTMDELKTLENTPMNPPIIKQAFLFSCFTGLRFSDVIRLTWGKLQKDSKGDTCINFVQKKTDKQEYLPIPQRALNYLPDSSAAKATDIVFKLPTNKFTNVVLRNWAFAVGINKKVTFHVARHTYATLLLTLETPIEVVSKNLGHSDIQTTQIYAKVVNSAQRAAADKLNSI
ncbi:MAG: site-specific integrase [Prevotellaceae bacterium]|jgi:integrase|nr:site-specific integrase [Prevotellaceae bacterium]